MPMAMEHQTTAPDPRIKSVLARQCSAVWRLLSDGRWEIVHVTAGTDIGQVAQIAELFASICVGQLAPGATVTARFGEDMIIAQVDEHGVLVSMKERGGNPLMIKTAMSRLETRSRRNEETHHTAKTAAGTAGSRSRRSSRSKGSQPHDGPRRSAELDEMSSASSTPDVPTDVPADVSIDVPTDVPTDVAAVHRDEEQVATSEPTPAAPAGPTSSDAGGDETLGQSSAEMADELGSPRVETPEPARPSDRQVETPEPSLVADESLTRSSRASTRSARAAREIDLVAFDDSVSESSDSAAAESVAVRSRGTSGSEADTDRGGFDRENSLAFEIVFAEEDESAVEVPSIASSQFVAECSWADVETYFEEAMKSAADYLGRAVSANYWSEAVSHYSTIEGRISFGALGRISVAKPKLTVSPKEAEALSRAVDDWKSRAARAIGDIDRTLPQLDVQPWRTAHSREES